MWSEFEHDLELLESDIDSCMLDEEGIEVVTVIECYITRQTNKNTKCDLWQELLSRNTGNLSSDDYLNKLSRGGLTTPSTDLVQYVAKSFAILDCVQSILVNSGFPERKLSEYVLNCKSTYPDAFLCNNHKDVRSRIHRIITKIYFINEQKKLKDSALTDSAKFSNKDKEKDKKHTKEFSFHVNTH